MTPVYIITTLHEISKYCMRFQKLILTFSSNSAILFAYYYICWKSTFHKYVEAFHIWVLSGIFLCSPGNRDRKFLEANYLLFWVNKDRDSNSFQSHLVMSLRRNLPSFQGNRHRNDLLPSRETFAYIPG